MKIVNLWFPVRGSGWGRAERKVSYVIVLILLLVGYMVPEELSSNSYWAKSLTDIMASLVPQIDNVSIGSVYEKKNKFYYSLLWSIAIIFVPLMIKEQVNFLKVDEKKRSDVDWSLHFLRIVMMLLLSVYAMFWLRHDPGNRVSYMLFDSGVFRVVWAPVIVYGTLWPFVYMGALVVKNRQEK